MVALHFRQTDLGHDKTNLYANVSTKPLHKHHSMHDTKVSALMKKIRAIEGTQNATGWRREVVVEPNRQDLSRKIRSGMSLMALGGGG